MNQKVKLIALSSGTSKKGNKYYRGVFKTKLSDGNPVIREYFLPVSVGDECKRNGILEDVDVMIEAGFNEFLGLEIQSIRLADDEEEVF
jgi:hypothetical protein